MRERGREQLEREREMGKWGGVAKKDRERGREKEMDVLC